LDHLILRDGIHILHSKNQKNTVERIYELINNYLSIKPSPLIQYDNAKDNIIDVNVDDQVVSINPVDIIRTAESILKQKIIVDSNAIIYKIWCCIPNITEKTACLFINKNYHISDLILGKINKDDIYSLKYDNGYIIGNRSEKIWKYSQLTSTMVNDQEIFDNLKYYINMLSQINGITKVSAKTILTEIKFKDLLDNKINKDILQNIKISETRRLGKKKSEYVLKYFRKV
jgi:hypothetical protein